MGARARVCDRKSDRELCSSIPNHLVRANRVAGGVRVCGNDHNFSEVPNDALTNGDGQRTAVHWSEVEAQNQAPGNGDATTCSDDPTFCAASSDDDCNVTLQRDVA